MILEGSYTHWCNIIVIKSDAYRMFDTSHPSISVFDHGYSGWLTTGLNMYRTPYSYSSSELWWHWPQN